MSAQTPVPGLLRGFFEDYLAAQRDVSQNTIYAYRDACKLFLRFAARHRGRQVIRLQLADPGADTVLAFLTYLESDRHNSAATRNCRLVAIHRFFAYVAGQDPRHAELCRRVPGSVFGTHNLETDDFPAALRRMAQTGVNERWPNNS